MWRSRNRVPKVVATHATVVHHWLRRVGIQDWAWVNFFIAVGLVWPLLTLAAVPTGIEHQLQTITILTWFGMAIAGCIISVTGILMYSQLGTKFRPIGAAAELCGLILMFAGPLLFGLFYLWMYFSQPNHGEVRPTVIGLAFALASGLAVRFVITVPRFRREKNDETKDV